MMKAHKKIKILSKKEFFEHLRHGKKVPTTSMIVYITILLAGCAILFFGIVYVVFLATLPPIEQIESNVLPESSIIYDRNGQELYKLYNKEKRTYVPIADISKYIQRAVISAEDKTFFENAGFDVKGLIRSGVNYILGKTDKVQGTSTISQQLIKNTFFTNERSISRKIKEVWLSYRLNTKYSKEKILEFYLNKIAFGNNAYGIEEASQTYFGKPSKDIGVLGASILASLPKGPTYYSPYNHRDRLMGSLYVYNTNTPSEQDMVEKSDKFAKYAKLLNAFKAFVTNMEFQPVNNSTTKICGLDSKFLKKSVHVDKTGCSQMAYPDLLSLLNAIKIGYNNIVESSASGTLASSDELANTVLEYNTGRKDFVLGRMLEDKAITADQYKNAVVGGLEFQFKKYSENIKAPYFVFYVKEYLENKYGKDFDSEGGLKIYTTLDGDLQNKAEDLVNKQVAINKKQYGATSAALVSLDNKTGQILAMVGGADYFSDDPGANVNVITSPRQPGSSFKPIVYSLAISKNPIGPETPVYDVQTKFGKWQPNDYDNQFMGRMPLKKALDYSRNIPAAKLFYLAGGEDAIVKYGNSLGIDSLRLGMNYGAPMAIGTAELKPIELASAYMTFANYGIQKDISSILKIEDKHGNIIEQYIPEEGKQVLDPASMYILTTILSDASSRPNSFWNNALTLKNRPVAAKTGTSDKDVSNGGKKKILPRDLWTAGYTPQITTVVWAGNVDGSETKGTCDGLNCAAPIWRDFMTYAHRKLPVETFKRPEGVYSATISKISGKLVGTSTPDDLRVSSIFAVKPTEYENSLQEVEVDMLCNGKVTDKTPPSAIKRGYLMNTNPIIDSYDPTWLVPVQAWLKGNNAADGTSGYSSLITQVKDTPCDRPGNGNFVVSASSNIYDGEILNIGKNKINVNFQADNPIVKIQALLDGKIVNEYPVDNKTVGSQDIEVDFGTAIGNHALTLDVYDSFYYMGSVTYNVILGKGDTQVTSSGVTDTINANTDSNATGSTTSNSSLLSLSVVNPTSGKSSIFDDQYVNIRWSVNVQKEIVSNVYIDGKLTKILSGGPDFVYAFNNDKSLTPGDYVIKLEAVDENGNKSSKEISISVMKR